MSQIGRDQAGNLWEYDGLDANGEPINPRPAAQQGQPSRGTVYTPPPAPKAPREAPPGYRWTTDGGMEVIPGGPADKPDPSAPGSTPDVTAKIRADALTQFGGARMIGSAQTDLISAYKNGPGKTSGIQGLWDYLPGVLSERNQRFDKDGEGIQGRVVNALGLTGGSVNSMAEAKMWTGPYVPTSSDRDGTTRDGIDRLSPLRESAARDSVSILGGVPDLDGTIHPIGSPRANQILASIGLTPDLKAMPNVWDQESIPKVSVTAAAGSFGNSITGNTRMREQNDPETAARAKQAWLSGASYDQVNQIHKDAGYDGLSIEEWNAIEPWRKKGRGKEVVWVTAREVPMSRAEELAGSPAGAFLAGIANAGSFGGVQRLAPEQMQAIQALNPPASFVGEVIGSIGGASMLGKLGQGIAGRLGGLGSKLATGGGRGGNLARGVGTDAAYAGIYGENTGQGALPSAGLGALGSAGGRLVGGVLGKGITGFARATGADELVNRGIPLTTGQQLGGMAKSFEDRLAGYPILDDVVNARRTEGLQGYNLAEFQDAGKGIGFSPTDYGEAGLDQLRQAKGAAYSKTLDPVQIDTLNDPQLVQDVAQARMAASQIPNVQPSLPRDYIESSLESRLQGTVDPNGMMSGRNFQESYRGLSRDARSRANSDFGYEIGDTARLGQDALAGALERQNPGAFSGFKAANDANRRISVLTDAMNRARNGTRSGEVDLFMPSQMIDAAAANKKKFPGGLDLSLAKAAQTVLPSKIGDSGTAGRALLAAGSLATVGGGTGYATGGDVGSAATGTLTPLALAGLLALGGTKGGQKAINAALFKRPAALKSPTTRRRLGELQGLFGAAMVPLMLESGN